MSWTELTQHPNFPLWILLGGLLLTVLAVLLIGRKINFFKRSQIALDPVVSFDRRSALEGNLWQSTVEFVDDQNAKHRLEYTGSGPYPPFAKTKKLKVYYDPQNPKRAYAYTFWRVWSMELAISGMALLMVLVGVGNLYF